MEQRSRSISASASAASKLSCSTTQPPCVSRLGTAFTMPKLQNSDTASHSRSSWRHVLALADVEGVAHPLADAAAGCPWAPRSSRRCTAAWPRLRAGLPARLHRPAPARPLRRAAAVPPTRSRRQPASTCTGAAGSASSQTVRSSLGSAPGCRSASMARKSWRRRRSVAIRQRTSACARVYSISRGDDQVFRPTEMAPICWMARKDSSHSARLPIRMATWSPRCSPSASSPRASRLRLVAQLRIGISAPGRRPPPRVMRSGRPAPGAAAGWSGYRGCSFGFQPSPPHTASRSDSAVGERIGSAVQ